MKDTVMVISNTNLFNFNKELNEHLKTGWIASGELIVTSTPCLSGHANSFQTSVVTTYIQKLVKL